MKVLTIGELAKQTSISVKSIRYYEQEGLLPKARRSITGYRQYDTQIVERIKFIQKAKSVGFHLDEICKILELVDGGRSCCDQVFDFSEIRLQELDKQIQFLTQLRDRLSQYREKWTQQKLNREPLTKKCELIEAVKITEDSK